MMGLTGKQTGAAAAPIIEQDSTMTKIDCLIEVAQKLREAAPSGNEARTERSCISST